MKKGLWGETEPQWCGQCSVDGTKPRRRDRGWIQVFRQARGEGGTQRRGKETERWSQVSRQRRRNDRLLKGTGTSR